MADMRVRVEVEIFDNMGDSITLVGASRREYTGGDNPIFFPGKFDETVNRIRGDIREQLVAKHGDRPKDNLFRPSV